MKRLNFHLLIFVVLTLALISGTSCSKNPPTAGGKQQLDESKLSSRVRDKLNKLRERLAGKSGNQQSKYKVAYSKALEHDVGELAGIEIPDNAAKQNGMALKEALRKRDEKRKQIEDFLKDSSEEKPDYDIDQKIIKDVHEANPDKKLPNDLKSLLAYMPEFDWSDYINGTEVKNQLACNSCWAFATVAAVSCNLEIQSSYAYSIKVEKKRNFEEMTIEHDDLTWYDPSEQTLLSCIGKKKGSCSGGWPGTAFNYFITNGLPAWDEEYTGKVDECVDDAEKIKVLAWDYVTKPANMIPSPAILKEALLKHGPLVVLVHIDDNFLGYDGGIFDEKNDGPVNHAVLLMGWDDKEEAWLIQNSWGTDWGEDGMMWIAWNSNSIGQYATWVEASLTDVSNKNSR